MVAEVRADEVEVGTEGGEWIVIKSSLTPQYIEQDDRGTRSTDEYQLRVIAVMGFTYEGKKQQQVSGMLLGACRPLFGGQVCAHYAHYVRPTLARDPKLRSSASCNADKHELQSFAIGDVVKQLMPSSGHTAAHAVVVRVLYSSRNGRNQARKWLVLVEAHASSLGVYSANAPFSFFPASWVNWERVPCAQRSSTWTNKAERDSPTAQCSKLSDAQVMEIEEVCRRMKVEAQQVHQQDLNVWLCSQAFAHVLSDQLKLTALSLNSISRGIKYAGQNMTPLQRLSISNVRQMQQQKRQRQYQQGYHQQQQATQQCSSLRIRIARPNKNVVEDTGDDVDAEPQQAATVGASMGSVHRGQRQPARMNVSASVRSRTSSGHDTKTKNTKGETCSAEGLRDDSDSDIQEVEAPAPNAQKHHQTRCTPKRTPANGDVRQRERPTSCANNMNEHGVNAASQCPNRWPPSSRPNHCPPNGYPHPNSYPPSGYPPNPNPPSAYPHPNGNPPSSYHPNADPCSAYPQNTYPPQVYLHHALPPNAYNPPHTYPPNVDHSKTFSSWHVPHPYGHAFGHLPDDAQYVHQHHSHFHSNMNHRGPTTDSHHGYSYPVNRSPTTTTMPRSIRLRRDIDGLKAAQLIEPTAMRAQQIASLEVELEYIESY